jgi:hypothetical protein
MPVAAEQIASRGYQLQNSTLVANPVGFGLSASGANYQVNSTTGDDVIGLVGEIMANSALAQTLTQPSNTPLAGSSAGAIPVVPTVTSKPSVAANNSQNSTTSTKPVSHEKVPTDTNVKLTIEEKNEQY